MNPRILVAIGAVVVFWAPLNAVLAAEADPCKAKQDYIEAEDALNKAEAARKNGPDPTILQKTLYQSLDMKDAKVLGLVNDPSDPNEKLPEEKVKLRIASLGEQILRYERWEESSLPGGNEQRYWSKVTSALKTYKTGLEKWLTLREKRDLADKELQEAKPNYLKAILAKDAAVRQARQALAAEQVWLDKERSKLRGQPQNEAYQQKLSAIKTRALTTLLTQEIKLAPFADCFLDADSVLKNIRQRREKVEAIYVPTRFASKPSVAPPSSGFPRPLGAPIPPTGMAPKPKPIPIATADFTGSWDSSEGRMNLTQTGNRVMGTYAWAGGKINGTVTGNTLKFIWVQTNNREGTGEFTMSPGGQSFTGTWKYTVPADHIGRGGNWNGSLRSKTPDAP